MHEEIAGFIRFFRRPVITPQEISSGTLSDESLSVLIPVSHNYHVRGYIAIHVPLTVLTHEKESYLLPYYITLIALAMIALLFAAADWLIVYHPLRKLRRAQVIMLSEISRLPSPWIGTMSLAIWHIPWTLWLEPSGII